MICFQLAQCNKAFLVRRQCFDLFYNVCEKFDNFLRALAVYRKECFVVALNNSVSMYLYRHFPLYLVLKALFIRVRITDSPDMTLTVGRGRKARKHTNE